MMGKKEESSRAVQIGERIKQARLEQGGMKQRELADLLGVSERSVIAYENGEVIPYRFMRALEQALEVSASWILHGDEAESPDMRQVMKELREIRQAIEGLAEKVAGPSSDGGR